MNNPITGMLFFVITIMAVGAAVAIFKMKYDAASRQAKQQAEGDASYRDLAARAVKMQEDNAALLTDIAARLTSVEKLLKEVG
jgi:hypothetical protein